MIAVPGLKLIGITGLVGAGKDSLGRALSLRYGYRKMLFAYTLKQMLRQLPYLGSSTAWEDDLKWKEAVHPFYGKSPRQMAQTLGTEWGRKLIGEDLWIKIAEFRLLAFVQYSTNPRLLFVYTDLRFENEAQWIRSNGGIIVCIKRASAGSKYAHSSEAGIKLSPSDYIVYNDGPLSNLKDEADKIHTSFSSR